jgi:hypothetical protein
LIFQYDARHEAAVPVEAKQVAPFAEGLLQVQEEDHAYDAFEVEPHVEDQKDFKEEKGEDHETEEEEEEEQEEDASELWLALNDESKDVEVEPDPRDEDNPDEKTNDFYPWKNWTRAFMSIWILIYKPPQRMLNSLLMVYCSSSFIYVGSLVLFMS